MAKLSITTAWNESAAFVAREGRLIFPIAFLLMALPGGVLQLFMPQPGATPDDQAGAMLMILPLALVVGAIGMIGAIAISYLALRPGSSVGEALQVGGRRAVMLFVAWLIVGLAAILALIPIAILFGAFGALGGFDPARPEETIGTVILIMLVFGLLLLALWARLILMTSVAAVEGGGPIAIIVRSWELTAGHFWKLVLLLLLLFVAMMVVLFAVSIVAGLLIMAVAGAPEPGSFAMILAMLVSAVVQTVISALLTTLFAKIYAQLSGWGQQASVFS